MQELIAQPYHLSQRLNLFIRNVTGRPVTRAQHLGNHPSVEVIGLGFEIKRQAILLSLIWVEQDDTPALIAEKAVEVLPVIAGGLQPDEQVLRLKLPLLQTRLQMLKVAPPVVQRKRGSLGTVGPQQDQTKGLLRHINAQVVHIHSPFVLTQVPDAAPVAIAWFDKWCPKTHSVLNEYSGDRKSGSNTLSRRVPTAPEEVRKLSSCLRNFSILRSFSINLILPLPQGWFIPGGSLK
ncbi:MAG: hypothetical protein ABIN58_02905 [candidate division WOR-3 bacterium]